LAPARSCICLDSGAEKTRDSSAADRARLLHGRARMNHRLTAILLLGAGAVLGGCSSDGGPSPGAPGTGGSAGASDAGQAGVAGSVQEAGADAVPETAAEAGEEKVQWLQGPSMKVGRWRHTATVLSDGHVLVTGGLKSSGAPIDGTEVLAPDGSKWIDGPAMNEPRGNHGAALLSDGRVLIVGGGLDNDNGMPSGQGISSTAELFDPATSTLSDTAPLSKPRSHFAIASLATGKVLVAGGMTSGGSLLDDSEIYDPTSGTWSSVSGPTGAPAACGWAVLTDGRVLMAGGIGTDLSDQAFLFDGAAWTDLPPMNLKRYSHSVAALPSGRALAIAGIVGNNMFSRKVERLSGDPLAWAMASDMTSDGEISGPVGGTGTVALALPSGRVLVTGSYGMVGTSYLASRFSALYDDASDTWTHTGKPLEARATHSATRLKDGRVVIAGGLNDSGLITNSVEVSSGPVQ
jgi:hypothetical protein